VALEAHVVAEVFARGLWLRRPAAVIVPELERSADTSRQRAQLLDLADAYAKRLISMAEWLSVRETVEAELNAIEAAASDAAAAAIQPPQSLLREERWAVASTEERRAALAASFRHVAISPTRSKKWAPERVDICWRDADEEPEDYATRNVSK